MNIEEQISAYNKERDIMLLQRNIDVLIAFKRQHRLRMCSTRAVEEIGMHKAITAVLSLPMDFRRQSKEWLSTRGYSSMDDGDL